VGDGCCTRPGRLRRRSRRWFWLVPDLAGSPGIVGGTGLSWTYHLRPGVKFENGTTASADDPISGFVWFAYLNTVVKPMNNLHCRMAVEYAAGKTTLQTAYGGPVAGGAIASTVAPPNVLGQTHFDYYEATTKPGGDVAKAKAQLKLCGHPTGAGLAGRLRVLPLHHGRKHDQPGR
jgi:ABC-type transport system substrate-binding protein